jgi:CheY-like chemotaxis protein
MAKTSTAPRASDAAASLHLEKIGLVILDLMLPEMNGPEPRRWMKARRSRQLIPVQTITNLPGVERAMLRHKRSSIRSRRRGPCCRRWRKPWNIATAAARSAFQTRFPDGRPDVARSLARKHACSHFPLNS